MTIVMPESVPTYANAGVKWVAAIATLTTPKLTEVSAVSPASLDISCALYSDSFQPGQSVSRSAAPRRLCSTTSFERTTDVTRSIPDITYAIAPQAASGSDGKKPYEVLTDGLSGFLVARFGVAPSVPWAVGQFVNVYPVTLRAALIQNPSDDGAEFNVMQAVDVRAAIVQNVALIA